MALKIQGLGNQPLRRAELIALGSNELTNNNNNNITTTQMSNQFPGLTADGEQWLMRALDPFHDDNLEKVGFPDHMSSPSVVIETMSMRTISCPAALAAGNWDCHVVQTPLAIANENVAPWSYNSGATSDGTGLTPNVGILDYDAAGTLTQFGGLTVDCVASGANTFSNTPVVGGRFAIDASSTLVQTIGGSAGDTGRCRLVASGFEIENTTAPLYKQGALTVYSSPSSPGLKTVRPADTTGAAVRGQVALKTFGAPPRTEGKARLFHGSRTWHAENGCYVPARINSLVNPAQDFAGELWLAEASDNGVIHPSFAPAALAVTVTPGVTLANACGNQYPNMILPIDNTGAYLTGLSPQTTLTIIFRQTWEFFPSSNSTLARVAQPSPMYDHKALEMYSHILRTLPIGTVRGDNDGGKWFRGVLTIAKSVAPAAIRYGAAALGQGVAGELLASSAKAMLSKQLKKEQAKKKAKATPAIPSFASASNAMKGRSPARM